MIIKSLLVIILFTVADADIVLKHTRSEARSGNITAQFELAGMHHHGLGTSQDYKKAVSWYTKASAGGQSKAQQLKRQ